MYKAGLVLLLLAFVLHFVFNYIQSNFEQKGMTSYEFYIFKVNTAFIFNQILAMLPTLGFTLLYYHQAQTKVRILSIFILITQSSVLLVTIFRIYTYGWFNVTFLSFLLILIVHFIRIDYLKSKK